MLKKVFVVLAVAVVSSPALATNWQALPSKAPEPADNISNPAKIELGKALFMDPRFSSTGTVSCNSCHNVMEGGDDDRAVSMGIHGKTGGRNAPTVWNAAFHSVQFWDGRAAALEDQAKGPVTNPVEMGASTLDEALARVKAYPGYNEMFKQAYPGDKNPVTVANAAKAVAAFERTLITPNSPYDRYVKGDKRAMTEQQVRGMKLFADTGCTACHSGAAFNGPANAVGTGFYAKFPTFPGSAYETKYKLGEDAGRYEATKQEADRHMFRVPTLRNIALTAPYFHNGAVASLGDAVRVMAKTQLNKDLKEDEVKDITAFLGALTGEFPKLSMPRLPGLSGETVVK
jgi:cytochrome c peroxidase